MRYVRRVTLIRKFREPYLPSAWGRSNCLEQMSESARDFCPLLGRRRLAKRMVDLQKNNGTSNILVQLRNTHHGLLDARRQIPSTNKINTKLKNYVPKD